jgi:hypothetical protein
MIHQYFVKTFQKTFILHILCYQENNFNTQWVTGDWGPGFKVDLTLPKIYCVILHIIFFD